MKKIEAREVVKLLEQIIDGSEKVEVREKDYGFDPALSQFKCWVGQYKISFFIDAGELDYVDEVTCEDGRSADFDYWTEYTEYKKDPLEFLSSRQLEKLADIFTAASKGP